MLMPINGTSFQIISFDKLDESENLPPSECEKNESYAFWQTKYDSTDDGDDDERVDGTVSVC